MSSLWYSSGFIMYEWRHEFMGFSYAFHMIFWALSISSGFSTYIRMLLDNIFPNCLCFERLCGPCTVPNLMCVQLWSSKKRFPFSFAFYFLPIVLLIKWSMSWAEHSDHQNVHFVSLRMICKTIIWCNQILIVKQQRIAVIVTSRIIFPFGIFLVLKCSLS